LQQIALIMGHILWLLSRCLQITRRPLPPQGFPWLIKDSEDRGGTRQRGQKQRRNEVRQKKKKEKTEREKRGQKKKTEIGEKRGREKAKRERERGVNEAQEKAGGRRRKYRKNRSSILRLPRPVLLFAAISGSASTNSTSTKPLQRSRNTVDSREQKTE